MYLEYCSLFHSLDRVLQCLGTTFIIFVIMLILLCCGCWIYRHFYSNLPAFNLEPISIYLKITAKNIPFSTFIFFYGLERCKRFQKYGLVIIWFLIPLMVVLDEKYVKIFANERAAVNKALYAYDHVGEMLGKGLLTIDGESWWRRRKMLNPVFRLGHLKSHVSAFNEGAQTLVKELLKVCIRPTTEVSDILKTYTLKILCESILGTKLDVEMENGIIQKYLSHLERLSEYTVYRFSRPWLWWRWTQLLFPSGRKHRKYFKEFQSFSIKMLMELKASISDHHVQKNSNSLTEDEIHGTKSFAHILLENHLKDPSLTMEDVRAEVNLIIFAGHDTVSHTMLWCLFMLALHPEIQEKAFQEVTSVAGNSSYYSYADLNELVYLESFIKETLRLFPTVPAFGRTLTRNVKCDEYDVPKNTIICFVPYLIHRNPRIYPDPEKFDPERFSQSTLEHPWAYMPFSEGMRSCIGKKFAIMEMKILLAHILKNFRITSLDKREEIALRWNLLLTPSRPIRFHFTSRQSIPLPKG